MKRLTAVFALAFAMFFFAACEPDEAPDPEPEEVDITLESDVDEADLTVDPDTSVEEGTEVTVTASEVEGYEFLHWYDEELGATVSEERSYTFDADVDLTLEAVYEELETATIDLTSEHEDADLTADPEAPVLGEDVVVSASEIAGYDFEGWLDTETDEIVSEERTYTFEAQEDVTLEALYAETVPDTADEMLEAFEGDLSHLEPVIDEYEESEAVTTEMTMHLEEEVDGETEAVTLHKEQAVFTYPEQMVDTSIEILTPEEDLDFRIVVQETGELYQVFIDAGMFLDMIEEEEDMDLREPLDIDSDFVQFTIPEAFIDDGWDMFLSEFADDFDEDLDPEDIEAMLEDLEEMEKYFELGYYSALDALEVGAHEENGKVVTEMTMTSEVITAVFEDMFEDFYTAMAPLDEEMPPYEDFVEEDEYQELLDFIDTMETFDVAMSYDPDTQGMSMDLDILGLLEQFDEEGDLDDMVAMEFSYSITPDADMPDIEDAESVERIAEEVLQLIVMVESHQFAEGVHDSDIDAGTYTLEDLAQEGLVFEFPLVDFETSEVTVDDNPEGLILEFYYSSNQESVFHPPITLDVLREIDPGREEMPTRDEFLDIIDPVDEENIELQLKLFEIIELIFEEMEEDVIELPEEDLEGEDHEALERYHGSVIVYYEDHADYTVISYLAETSKQSAFEYFEAQLQEGPMEIIHAEPYDAIVAEGDPYFFDIEFRQEYEGIIAIDVFIDEETDDNGADMPEEDVTG